MCRGQGAHQLTDHPIARVYSGGTIAYIHADRQGSVVALANASGVLSDGPYSYSAYGAGGDTSGIKFQLILRLNGFYRSGVFCWA